MKDIQHIKEFFSKPINEGRYDSLTRTVVKDILNDWKDQFDGEQGKLEFEEDYEMFNSKGQPINFELYAVLNVKKTKDNVYKVDGGADPTREGSAYLEVRFQVDPDDLPQKWEEIYMDLTDVVRHEIEHMTQKGSQVIASKEMEDDEMLRNLINLKVLPKSDYFKLEMEVDAMLQGMYLKAKKTKTPFIQVINDYFDKVKLSKNQRKDILDLWKQRAKALSLPLNENKPQSNMEPNTVFKIYDFLKSKLGQEFTSEFPIKSNFFFQLNDYLKGMNEAMTTAYEAKKEDPVDTITMDIPLFLRMLEYSREDASEDMDLHDVTEKANKLGKERGILSMEDYEEIVGAAEEIKENNGINYSKLIDLIKSADNPKNQPIYYNSDQGVINVGGVGYDKGNLIKVFNSEPGQSLDIKTLFYKANQSPEETKNAIESMDPSIKVEIGYGYGNEPFVKYIKSINEGELTEANVPSNIAEFAKRKGVSSLVRKVAGWAEKVGAGIRGGTAIGKDYSTLILDMTYQGSEIRINTDNDTVTLYDEPVNSFNQFQRVYLENKEENNGLEERIHEALNKINEELCPAGKAYIKKRKAAGEKSSAYLSGRAVKVCKGQMSGKAKKK